MSDVLTRFRTTREPEKVPPAPRQRAKKPPFVREACRRTRPPHTFVRSTAGREPWS